MCLVCHCPLVCSVYRDRNIQVYPVRKVFERIIILKLGGKFSGDVGTVDYDEKADDNENGDDDEKGSFGRPFR